MKKTGKVVLLFISLVCYIAAAVNLYKGFDKKNHYYNSEYSFVSNVNAYVGGDAYNYIINGAYFAGYCALGGALLICGTVAGAAGLCLAAEPQEAGDNEPLESNEPPESISFHPSGEEKAPSDAATYWDAHPKEYAELLEKKHGAEELLREQGDMPAEQREKVKAVLETINLELKRK